MPVITMMLMGSKAATLAVPTNFTLFIYPTNKVGLTFKFSATLSTEVWRLDSTTGGGFVLDYTRPPDSHGTPIFPGYPLGVVPYKSGLTRDTTREWKIRHKDAQGRYSNFTSPLFDSNL